MTITYRGLASTLLLSATTISMTFQLYRASVGTNPEVDAFGVSAGIAYAVLYAISFAVRSDRTWVWRLVAVVLVGNIVFGVVAYYPSVYDARPMELLDWAEGTAYTGLLLAALGCTLLRLTGATLKASSP